MNYTEFKRFRGIGKRPSFTGRPHYALCICILPDIVKISAVLRQLNTFVYYLTTEMNVKKILEHVLLWVVLYLFWILVFRNRTFSFSRTISVEFCYLFFVAGCFYFNARYNIPRFLYQQRYLMFSILFTGVIVVAALLRVPVASYLNSHVFMPGKPQPGFDQFFLQSFLNIFIWVICLVTCKLILERVRFQQYIATIQKEKSKTELDFLQAQFNPHFLFNSINSIYGHIDRKNISARNMLLTFSEMLRYQLYECNTETIEIDKELCYIKNYIALQQSRMEESLIVRLRIDESVRGFTIAPLLFMAFIENSFKYVSNHDEKENKVEISFMRSGDTLFFMSYNTKEHNSNSSIEHKGIGIANVKRRLELLYPGEYELFINNREEEHEVILQLNLS